jgi:hypothetical protein
MSKISNICSLLLKSNQKASSDQKRDAQRERTVDAWFLVRVMDDHIEEDEVPLKRKRLTQASKRKQACIGSGSDPSRNRELFQLPNVCEILAR